MQPLGLKKDIKWRVIRCNRISLNPTKIYYVAKTTFQQVEVFNPAPRQLTSSRYQTVEFNLSQIKYFPIGSIWENDKMIEGVDYFETFLLKNSALFKIGVIQKFSPDGSYIRKQFQPIIQTEKSGEFEFKSSLCIYEAEETFSLIADEGKTYQTKFIAFPCYEIARYFLFSIGTYNSRLIQSNLIENTQNLLFDNSSTLKFRNENNEVELCIKLKKGIPYRRYLNVADLATSENFRREAMKLHSFMQGGDPFKEIELPITKFNKLKFSAKRVKNENDEWGLWVSAIYSCTGYRNFDKVEVDHEDPSKKKNKDQPFDDWEEEEEDYKHIRTINTGTSEDYNHEDNTNNDLPPMIKPTSQLMASFAEESEIVPYHKINEDTVSARPANIVINEIEANEQALQTEESDRNSNVQPTQFDEGGETRRYDSNALRDKSETSVIYPDRFFQDFEKIINLIREELKKTHEKRFSIQYADENLNFDSEPEKFKLLKMESGNRTLFPFRHVTKKPRYIYLVEFKINNRYLYLLEPQFKSPTHTTTTFLFHKTSYFAASKEELQRFFHVYIPSKGIKKSMMENTFIKTQFVINASDHEVVKTQIIEIEDENGKKQKKKINVDLTVGEALKRHAEKLAKKLVN